MQLTQQENDIIDRHIKGSQLRDGVRVLQWEGASSVFKKDVERIWVHNHHPRRQSYQEFYFHSVRSVANTLTCSHPVKFWDLRRRATFRETARLQGFPDSFTLPQTRVNMLFGNAVAVPCAAHAVECVCHDAPHDVRHIDVCAGIGGFACAVNRVRPGAVCVGFSEILPAAIKCYLSNYPQAVPLGDASVVTEWPHCDLLTAGFPCQPFSTACLPPWREAHAKLDFFEIVLNAISETRASRIVLENVPTLLTIGAAQWKRLYDALQAQGFEIDYAILNACNFGLPQQRKRMYIVGRRDGGNIKPLADYAVNSCATLNDILEK